VTGLLSVGVAATLDHAIVARLAPRLEELGFSALWVNDTAGADALAALAVAAQHTERLRLAVGVIPMDRRPPAAILADIAERGLPEDRLVLGVGSGSRRGPGMLATVRTELAELRSGTSAPVVLGALGPRMRRLGAEAADGVLLSWLAPDGARTIARDLDTSTALYVRATFDPTARTRLETEAARYAAYPAYAAHFDREGLDPLDTVVDRDPDRVAAYRHAVDEVVLRAIVAAETEADYLEFAEAAAG
jgi:alkanesulfonate monooxygenase SsuD/methylene tetrahydromethanopterin reductase-like flavin-dependent oxidoreductase (luciferase family)